MKLNLTLQAPVNSLLTLLLMTAKKVMKKVAKKKNVCSMLNFYGACLMSYEFCNEYDNLTC